MNQKVIRYGSIAVIIISLLVSGYFLLNPKSPNQNTGAVSLAPIIEGKQVLAMTVKSVSYSPSYFKVKAGVPVKWEITSSGEPGCASGVVIANGLTDPIYLNPERGQLKVVEFTPQTPGTYKFNCSMNMVRGTIEVVN